MFWGSNDSLHKLRVLVCQFLRCRHIEDNGHPWCFAVNSSSIWNTLFILKYSTLVPLICYNHSTGFFFCIRYATIAEHFFQRHGQSYVGYSMLRTWYTMYKKLTVSKVEKFKTTIFPSVHLISLLNKPNVQKWFPFGKLHEVW